MAITILSPPKITVKNEIKAKKTLNDMIDILVIYLHHLDTFFFR